MQIVTGSYFLSFAAGNKFCHIATKARRSSRKKVYFPATSLTGLERRGVVFDQPRKVLPLRHKGPKQKKCVAFSLVSSWPSSFFVKNISQQRLLLALRVRRGRCVFAIRNVPIGDVAEKSDRKLLPQLHYEKKFCHKDTKARSRKMHSIFLSVFVSKFFFCKNYL